ncbi:MAG: hypothetical protein RLZZ342_473 [Candidatus Parcubacteria bacterium]|jgi:hypothetical protein
MSKHSVLFLLALLFLPSPAIAVINGISQIADPGVPKNGNPTPVRVTCYGPGYDPKMEGLFETSRTGPNGKAVPCTLDDFRLQRRGCWYVTLAGNQANYNKYFNMGTITYVSVEDGREYTMTNVLGFVHDTGSAFNSSGCAKYNTCGIMMQKFDVAYGDYRNGGNINLVNKSAFCANKSSTWLQVGGQVDRPMITDGGYVGGNTGGPGNVATGSGTNPYYPMQPAGSPYASASPVPASSGSGSSGGGGAVPVSQQIGPASPFSAVSSNPAATNLQTALQQPNTPAHVPNAPSVGQLIVQPLRSSKEGSFHLSWTSLNMRSSPVCTVRERSRVLGEGSEGSRSVVAREFPTGTSRFELTCTMPNGTLYVSSQEVTVE